jgi:hypothetical protein
VESSPANRLSFDATAQLKRLQSFLTLPRETIPRLTSREAASLLRDAGSRLGLQFVENKEIAPTFLLLPAGAAAPIVTLFGTWHGEPSPTPAAAIDGAERLALGAALAAVEAAAAAGVLGPLGEPRVALVVAPSAGAGSQGLDQLLLGHQERVRADAAYWVRISPQPAPRRRRIFLGARGRLVIALRGGDANPYRIRDQVVAELTESAYGPRPLDFELIRKLAQDPGAVALLREHSPDAPGAARDGAGDDSGPAAEERIRRALFLPRGDVVIPAVTHPERPRAWLTFEIAEAMEPEPIAQRLESLSGGGRAELVERFPWDRANIHHPAAHALIELAKTRSEGPEIWPSAPWTGPSGLFTRALGSGLFEWGIPLPVGAAFRLPKPAEFESIALEIAELLLRVGSAPRPS